MPRSGYRRAFTTPEPAFHFPRNGCSTSRNPCSTSRNPCSTSSEIDVPLRPKSVFHFLRNTHVAGIPRRVRDRGVARGGLRAGPVGTGGCRAAQGLRARRLDHPGRTASGWRPEAEPGAGIRVGAPRVRIRPERRKLVGRSARRSCGPGGVSTRCARPPRCYGPSGDTPPVPPLRLQLWALRPGLDGGVPADHDDSPDHGDREGTRDGASDRDRGLAVAVGVGRTRRSRRKPPPAGTHDGRPRERPGPLSGSPERRPRGRLASPLLISIPRRAQPAKMVVVKRQ